jgi:hypothetical protein
VAHGSYHFRDGTVIVALHNVWSTDWRLLVTLLAWLTVVNGAIIMLFPSSMRLVYQRLLSNRLLTFSGIYALLLGALLLLLGLTK